MSGLLFLALALLAIAFPAAALWALWATPWFRRKVGLPPTLPFHDVGPAPSNVRRVR